MKKYFVLFLLFPSVVFGLSTGTTVNLSAAGSNSLPQVAVASNGNATTIWLTFPNQIMVSTFTSTSNSWTSPFTLALGSAPRVAIDGTGNTIVVWVTSTNQINASRFNVTTQTWSSAYVLSSTDAISSFPQISMNDRGVGLVVWIQNTTQVLASSFNPNTLTFSTPTTFLSNTVPASFQLDNNNRGIAVWQNGPTGRIQAARIFVP